jgi:hypothetical protein
VDATTCTRCNMSLPRSARFCRRCGERIGEAKAAATPWWRFQSLGALGFRLDPLLWLFVAVGAIVQGLARHWSDLPGANAARIAGMIGGVVGSAICCSCGAIVCSAVTWRLASRSKTAAWVGGLVGVVLVIAIPHTPVPARASGNPAIPPGFTDCRPALKPFDSQAMPPFVPVPPPGFVPESQVQAELPATEIRGLIGSDGVIGPGFGGLNGLNRYLSAKFYNGSAWSIQEVTIQVRISRADGRLRSLEAHRTATNVGIGSVGRIDARLDADLENGETWDWAIVGARGRPASP